jgi:hypothetical protein
MRRSNNLRFLLVRPTSQLHATIRCDRGQCRLAREHCVECINALNNGDFRKVIGGRTSVGQPNGGHARVDSTNDVALPTVANHDDVGWRHVEIFCCVQERANVGLADPKFARDDDRIKAVFKLGHGELSSLNVTWAVREQAQATSPVRIRTLGERRADTRALTVDFPAPGGPAMQSKDDIDTAFLLPAFSVKQPGELRDAPRVVTDPSGHCRGALDGLFVCP